jgi:uncharacterized membrane protein YraQ (UPF0718 family)
MILLLVASIVPLALGPLLVRWMRPAPWAQSALDSFVLVSIGGLALLHILPQCFEVGGWLAVAGAFVGLAAPTWAERAIQSVGGGSWRRPILLVALLALLVHATLDGVALAGSAARQAYAQALAAAVIVHRVPVGIGLWWFVRTRVGLRAAIATLAVELTGTMAGFFLGDLATRGVTSHALAVFQALVAGSLLHVIVGHSHTHLPPSHHEQGHRQVPSALGGLVAVAFLVAMERLHPHAHDAEPSVIGAFLDLVYASAPPLLAAYVVVALASALLPPVSNRLLSGGSAMAQALRGVGLGMPTTICTCGVIPPHQRAMVRSAAPAAAVAFIVSASSLGLSAILLSFRLLGVRVAIVRIVSAAVLAMLAGLWIGRLAGTAPEPSTASLPPAVDRGMSLRERLAEGLRFSFGETVDHTAPWFLAGLGVAAFAQTYIRPAWVAAMPAGLDVPVAALLGVPTYICASGATPLAAVLMTKGVSSGAMVAFLLSGPATTLAVFGAPSASYSRRIVVLLGIGIVVVATVLGFGANVVVGAGPAPASRLLAEPTGGVLETLAVVVLGLVWTASLLRQGVRGFVQRVAVRPPLGPSEAGGHACEHPHRGAP